MAENARFHSILRPGLACIPCRERKRRCNGVKPTCGACETLGRPCQYNDGRRSRLQTLQDRVQELESAVGEYEGYDSGAETAVPSDRHRTGSSVQRPSPSGSAPDSRGGSRTQTPSMNRVEGRWWEAAELPSPVKSHLINLFISRRHALPMEFHVPRFLNSLTLPSTDPRSPHPALIDALCLIGCFFDRGPFQQHQDHFLTCTRKSMNDSLAFADRLLDFVRASTIVSLWHFFKSPNVRIAHHHAATTVRFAMGCGLHQLSLATASHAGGTMLPPPRDVIEFEDRINAFWSMYTLDRIGSLYASLPSALPADEDITTCWPLSWQAYDRRNAMPTGSIHALFTAENQLVYGTSDSTMTLLFKACAFFSRAARFSWLEYEPDTPPTSSFPGLYVFDRAISLFARSMPSLTFNNDGSLASDMDLVTVHTLIHSSSITIHGLFAAGDPRSVQICRDALYRVIAGARATMTSNRHISPSNGLGWEVSLAYLKRLKETPQMDATIPVTQVEEGIAILGQVTARLQEGFPASGSSNPDSVDPRAQSSGSSSSRRV